MFTKNNGARDAKVHHKATRRRGNDIKLETRTIHGPCGDKWNNNYILAWKRNDNATRTKGRSGPIQYALPTAERSREREIGRTEDERGIISEMRSGTIEGKGRMAETEEGISVAIAKKQMDDLLLYVRCWGNKQLCIEDGCENKESHQTIQHQMQEAAFEMRENQAVNRVVRSFKRDIFQYLGASNFLPSLPGITTGTRQDKGKGQRNSKGER